jgi:protocatechuate 3,4-dioxygenase alpha subunit
MKLIPTSSQTVGPFFSIGLAQLYQKATSETPNKTITLTGKIFDGDRQPIPDAVLEFWNGDKFARVATSVDGSYSVALELSMANNATAFSDVLIFMRGLLKPVRTRIYFCDIDTVKNNPELKAVPEDRVGTLFARKTAAPYQYGWDVFMQGESETVFFHI